MLLQMENREAPASYKTGTMWTRVVRSTRSIVMNDMESTYFACCKGSQWNRNRISGGIRHVAYAKTGAAGWVTPGECAWKISFGER
jgi:hypothetical protein